MLVLFYLEVVLILTQDSCMVCAKRTIGLEILLDAPMDLQGDIGHMESHLYAFRDSGSVSAR
jgi:hypothetical protein